LNALKEKKHFTQIIAIFLFKHCNIPNILNGEEIQRVESNKGYSLIANSTRGFVTILSDDRKKITIYDVNKS